MLLADFAVEWLRWCQGKVQIAPRTREIYASQLRLHILPGVGEGLRPLGEVPLASLTPELIRAWYAALAKHRSPSVAAKAYVRLRQILGQAVDDDRLPKNPCRVRGGGAERHREQRFASLVELYQLADVMPRRYRALVLTAGLAGLRQGELFGLRRGDVDLGRGVVSVRRKRLRLASGEVIEDSPKSDAGTRTVALPAPLVVELKQHLLEFAAPGPDAYVFTSSTGDPVERSNFRNRVWIPATRDTGLDGLRWHDLRHTAGTLAARTGATTKEIMARLGHASPRAAMMYQHASDDRDQLIAERLGAMALEVGLVPASTADGPSVPPDAHSVGARLGHEPERRASADRSARR